MMKEHLSLEDLKGLTIAQKEMLRSMWLPKVNDLAVASICRNVETEEYEDIPFVVGQVLIAGGARGQKIVLRRLMLVDDPEIGAEEDAGGDEDKPAGENPEDDWDESAGGYDEEDLGDEDGSEMMYIEPGQYFMIEDCLPLLSIGQMIALLRRSKIGQNGLQIYIPPETDRIIDRRLFAIEDSEGVAFESEGLCDLLWEAVKTLL